MVFAFIFDPIDKVQKECNNEIVFGLAVKFFNALIGQNFTVLNTPVRAFKL
jgi:hypothetical protein